jgi:hypothetical protein
MKEKNQIKMTEDDVVLALKAWLERDKWTVNYCTGMQRGIDIAATKGKRRLLIEAKGAKGNTKLKHTTRAKFDQGQIRVNLGAAIVKCLEMKRDNPDAEVAIAQPNDEDIRRCIESLVPRLAELGIKHYWVEPNGLIHEQ